MKPGAVPKKHSESNNPNANVPPPTTGNSGGGSAAPQNNFRGN